jgi:O-antigen ligase
MGAFLIYTLHFYGINLFSKTIKNKLSEAIVACSLAFLTFFPFWKMWAEHDVKRGSLLCLILIMSASALILRAFKTYFISMFIFILGFISIAAYQSQSIKNGDDHNLWAPIQHSEDLHDPRYAHEDTYNFPIKAHVRKLWWRQTIEKWSENKILGIGFIDELPPEIDIGSKNDWKTVLTEKRFRSTSPVSGPHQSLLNILTRMGVIGFLIFTAILIEAIVSMKKVYVRLRQNPCFADLLLLMIPLGGFIYAMLNVGFEAPHNSILFWFVLGLIP